MEPALESMERKLDVVRDRVRGVAEGYANGLFLSGRRGTSKTRTVRETLKELARNHHYHCGHLTPMGLFDLLDERSKDIIVLDDVGHILVQPVGGQLLLAALGNQPGEVGTRTVRYRRQGGESVVFFSGGIILISNSDLPATPLMQALESRIHCLHYDPSDKELAALMRHIARGGWREKGYALTAGQCLEVVEYVIDQCQRLRIRLDLRLLDKGLRDFAQWDEGRCETNWKDLVRFTIEQRLGDLTHTPRLARSRADRKQAEQQLVRELLDRHTNDRPGQLTEWARLTGKSERAFYRRLGELGAPGSEAGVSPGVSNCQTVKLDSACAADGLTV